ncbi:hypothetical protein K438DRAFT_1771207 [Mycena galopus ATCC 62051]|nr:hypothetical protein K438DRAFT_1771207 [Mycena galopus ATCC 62051]
MLNSGIRLHSDVEMLVSQAKNVLSISIYESNTLDSGHYNSTYELTQNFEIESPHRSGDPMLASDLLRNKYDNPSNHLSDISNAEDDVNATCANPKTAVHADIVSHRPAAMKIIVLPGPQTPADEGSSRTAGMEEMGAREQRNENGRRLALEIIQLTLPPTQHIPNTRNEEQMSSAAPTKPYSCGLE